MVWLGGPRKRIGRSQPIVLHDPPPGPHARKREVQRAEFRKAAKHDPHMPHGHMSHEQMTRAARKAASRQQLMGQSSAVVVVIMGLMVLVVAGLVVGLAFGLR